MRAGKLTIKHQVTVPLDVRRALGLGAGDHVAFAVEGGKAVMRKVDPRDEAWDRFALTHMPEWASDADDEAFRDL